MALRGLRAGTAIAIMPSQLGQDRLVLDLLGHKRGGFFLDSGAADGLIASNTHLLETAYAWRGICVEPNKVFYDLLVKNRRAHCVNCCLYDRDGDVDFLEQGFTLGGILDEYHPAHLRYAQRSFPQLTSPDGRLAVVTREARTVRSVLAQCDAPAMIDYWSLDTEGSELAILKSFPFDAYGFRVLTVEHNRLPVQHEIKALLESYGYRRVAELGIDDCYMPSGDAPRPAWRSKAFARTRTI